MSIRNKLVLFLLLGTAVPPVLAGECSREDVDHYLSQGFTPGQVVSLCGEAAGKGEVTEEVPGGAEPGPTAAAAKDDDRAERALAYLDQATRGKKWHIDEEGVLSFSHPVKVVFGEEDVFGNRQRVRPYIDVSVKLATLRPVGLTERIPLLRRGSVTLSGEMWLEAVGEEGFDGDERAAIQAYLKERRAQKTFKLETEPEAEAEQVRSELDGLARLASRD